MEIGNLLFGNSRGEYPVDCSLEDDLNRLFKAYDSDAYCSKYENSVFKVTPYYWGDCTCGFDDIDSTWDGEHTPECFQTELENEKLKNGWVKTTDGFLTSPKDLYKKELDLVKPLFEKRGWDTKCKNWWGGFILKCDCDYHLRYDKWLTEKGFPYQHREDCLLLQPNFLYKPTGLIIDWYKYPLRDSYSNQKIDPAKFTEIINHCIESI